MTQVEESSAPAATASGRRRSPFARLAWFGAALVLFSVSSFRAFRQEPRLDAYRRPSPLTADWWLHPIERNAPRRLPLVWGNLNDVFALRGKDAGKVWVAGEGGLILHSDDYGRHWVRQYLVRRAAPATGRTAGMAARARAVRSARRGHAARDGPVPEPGSHERSAQPPGHALGDPGELLVREGRRSSC
jgi:hypothetical protein